MHRYIVPSIPGRHKLLPVLQNIGADHEMCCFDLVLLQEFHKCICELQRMSKAKSRSGGMDTHGLRTIVKGTCEITLRTVPDIG